MANQPIPAYTYTPVPKIKKSDPSQKAQPNLEGIAALTKSLSQKPQGSSKIDQAGPLLEEALKRTQSSRLAGVTKKDKYALAIALRNEGLLSAIRDVQDSPEQSLRLKKLAVKVLEKATHHEPLAKTYTEYLGGLITRTFSNVRIKPNATMKLKPTSETHLTQKVYQENEPEIPLLTTTYTHPTFSKSNFTVPIDCQSVTITIQGITDLYENTEGKVRIFQGQKRIGDPETFNKLTRTTETLTIHFEGVIPSENTQTSTAQIYENSSQTQNKIMKSWTKYTETPHPKIHQDGPYKFNEEGQIVRITTE